MAREKWSGRTSFIFAAIGSAVGLGNAWRFPGLVAKHGGGAFLLVYVIAMILVGVPLLMTEVAIGRKTRQGAPGSMRVIHKKAEGIGWAATANAFVIACYYAVVFAWVLAMVVGAFKIGTDITGASKVFSDSVIQTTWTTSGYSIPWWMFIALFVAWGLIYYCIRNGVSSVSKVVNFTVSAPIVLLLILAVRGFLLPNAAEGLKVFFIPDFSALKDISLWVDAFGQVFYSLSVMMAIMFAYGSFLKRDSNIAADCVIIAVSDMLISVLAGIVMFTTMYGTGLQDSITSSGIATAFIVYPTAFASLTSVPIVNSIFACIFYLMLCTLAIDSAFSIIEGVSTALADKFGTDKKKMTIRVCIVAGIISILFITRAGLAWLDIVDNWCNYVNLLVIGILECVAIGWFFDVRKVHKEVNLNSKGKGMPYWWLNCSIRFVAPLVLSFLFIFNFIKMMITYADGGSYGYAIWAECVGGWLVSILVLISGLLIKFFTKRSQKARALEAETKTWDEINDNLEA